MGTAYRGWANLMADRVEQLYIELLKSAGSQRRRASVQAIYGAIRRHQLNKEFITVAAIARTKAQSIRNDALGLKALIELAVAEGPAESSAKAAIARRDDWIEKISDPIIRAGCRGLQEQAALLTRENDRLRATIRRLQPVDDCRESHGGTGPQSIRHSSLFSDREKGAVADFLSNLPSEGFNLEPSGEIVSRSGRSVAPPEFMSALLKVQKSGD